MRFFKKKKFKKKPKKANNRWKTRQYVKKHKKTKKTKNQKNQKNKKCKIFEKLFFDKNVKK